jgi:hypothetical protein
MGRVIRSILLGALLCAVLAATVFAVAALLDGGRVDEAIGFGLAVGIGGLVMGAFIGLVTGALRLGPLGGALAGALATLAAVGFYVLAFGRPGQLGYFLRESAVVVLVLGAPAVLTGVLLGWFGRGAGTTATTAPETNSGEREDSDHG